MTRYTPASPGYPSPGLPDAEFNADFYDGVAGKRFFAWIFDMVIVTLITAVGVVLTIGIGLFFLPVLWLVVDFLYRSVTLAGGGATYGQRIMGLRYLNAAGRKFDGFQAMLHTTGYLLSMAFILPQIASIVLVMTSGKRQNLTDMILGSAAVNRPATLL